MRVYRYNQVFLGIFIAMLCLFITTAKARPFNILVDTHMECPITPADHDQVRIVSFEKDKPVYLENKTVIRDKIWLRYTGDRENHTFTTSFGKVEPKNRIDVSIRFYPLIEMQPTNTDEISYIQGPTDYRIRLIVLKPLKVYWDLEDKYHGTYRADLNRTAGMKFYFRYYPPPRDDWDIAGLFDFTSFSSPRAFVIAEHIHCTIE
jgi:hypothetical protein